MTERTWFDAAVDELQDDVEFLTEGMAIDVANEIRRVMKAQRVTQSELARRMGASRAHISKLLNYTPNMTLRSLVAIAHALGMRWRAPELVGKGATLDAGQYQPPRI